MKVILEIHVPGLDMEQSRWTYHLIFMQEVHEKLESVISCARESYRTQGRGTVHISRNQWMDVVRDAVLDEKVPFPCSYVPADRAGQLEWGIIAAGFRGVIESYDPQHQMVLTVEHHPEAIISCYVIEVS